MKQIIIMTAMVLLGVFIATMVFSFEDSAENLNKSTIKAIQSVQARADENS